jgi:hypothetical protein
VAFLHAGLRQLLFNGLQPVKGVKMILPTTPDAKHDSYTPEQVMCLHRCKDLIT